MTNDELTAPTPPAAIRRRTERRVRLTTAQALVRWLQAQYSERDGEVRRAVPALFAIFGHGNAAGIGQAVWQEGAELPLLQPKNEQSMVHTALGYAKASRRLQTLACSASIGPGATNMLTGAATATTNRLPVLLLPADTFATRFQGHVLQQLEHPLEADATVNDAFRPLSRFFDRVARPEQLLTALPEAMRVLLDPAETGAVTVALHQDVQGEAWEFPERFFATRVWPVSRRPVAANELAAAAAALRTAERPLVIAGGGVRHSAAEHELLALAERFGLPVAETPPARSAAGRLPLAGRRHRRQRHARGERAGRLGRRRAVRRHAPERLHDRFVHAVRPGGAADRPQRQRGRRRPPCAAAARRRRARGAHGAGGGAGGGRPGTGGALPARGRLPARALGGGRRG